MNGDPKLFWLYSRFSSEAQIGNDSVRRQRALGEAWCDLHGYTLADDDYHDHAVSAWKGKNSGENGALRRLLTAIEDGGIPKGSVVGFESLDRISRGGIWKTGALLTEIVDQGVDFVTLKDGKRYDAEAFHKDIHVGLTLALTAVLAKQESDQKSQRVGAAWANKRSKAGETALTKNGPTWLKLNEDRKTWTIDEARADIVRKVYRLALTGIGPRAIATVLNKDKTPTLDNRAARYKGKDGLVRPSLWRPMTVTWLLKYRAVVGTMVTKAVVVESYFPPIVDAETFTTVQAMQTGKMRSRGSFTAGPVRNILSSLARCWACDQIMTRVTKAGGKNVYLVCDGARTGSGCSYRSARYPDIEGAIVRNAEFMCADAETAASDGTLLSDLHSAEVSVDQLQEQIGNLVDELARNPSPVIRERVDELGRTLVGERERLGELQARAWVSAGPMVTARLGRLREALLADVLDVGEANLKLKACVLKVVVDCQTGYLGVRWIHGGETSVLFTLAKD